MSHELRKFLCAKVELSDRGGLNLNTCIIVPLIPRKKVKRPAFPSKIGPKPRARRKELRV